MKLSEELKAKIENIKKTASACISANDVAGAKKAMAELKETQALLEAQLEIEKMETDELNAHASKAKKQNVNLKSVEAFAKAARTGFKASMSEGTLADGGYTVPEDISTQINEYKTAKFSLLNLVEVISVNTKSGERTYKTRSQQTGFTVVGESEKVAKKDTPKFKRQKWNVKKYGGYFPVTEELLEDSDQNIVSTLVQWIADESRVTANKLIIDALKTNAETEFKSLDDIKKALNVTLGQAFKATSKIITNDDGLQYFDTLKDSDDRYLLQPNPANPMELRLCAGATTVPIVVVPNADLPTEDNKIPVFIGDLNEAVTYFDKKHLTITSSDVAVAGDLNAFEDGLTLYKAVEREDVQLKDTQAVVNGYITVTTA